MGGFTMTEEQKNKDFIQLYRNHVDDIAKLAGENYTAYKMFTLLIKHMDGNNALIVSRTALSELLQCTEKTISRAVKYLKDSGWICVLKSGTSNVYIVNPDVAWTSYGNQKAYCQFQSNVLLSSTENAEYLNNPKAIDHFKTVNQDFIKSVQANKERFEKECEVLKAM
jgi:hypothetical protein